MYVLINGELYSYDGETLQHAGVKGMKWGVRRFQNKDGSLTPEGRRRYRQDKREYKTAKRHLAAAKKNIKTAGKLHAPNQEAYEEASAEYKKAMSSPAFSRKKKMERISNASSALTAAGAAKLRTQADLERANRIYNEVEKQYRAKVDHMLKEYGSESVKAISTKQVDLGAGVVKRVIKTGITVADIPVIGTYYTGRYISDLDYRDRERNISDNAKGRY